MELSPLTHGVSVQFCHPLVSNNIIHTHVSENEKAFEIFSELSWTLPTDPPVKAMPVSSKRLPVLFPSFQKARYWSVLSGQGCGRDSGGGRILA